MAASSSEQELDEARELLEAEEMSEDVTERLFSELRGINDAEVRIYSKDPDSQKLDYLFSTTGDAFTSITELYDQLRDEYDGGVFRIHVRKAGKMYRNEEIRVRPPKRRGIPDVPPATIADTGGGDMVNALAAVLERSNEQNREFMRMMIDTLKTSAPAAPDPAAMSQTILAGLVQMKELVGAPASSGMDIESFVRIAEFTREMGGGAGEANGWDALKASISGLAPMLMQGMQGMAAMPGMPTPAPAVIPAGGEPRRLSHDIKPDPDNPVPATSTTDAPADIVDPRELQARFEEVFPMCITAAQRDLDPFVYANLVIDQLGLEVAVNMICQPGQLDAMLAQAPQLQQWRSWFDELVSAMLEEKEQRVHADGSQGDANTDAANGDPAGPGGDSSNASSDGSASEAGAD